MNEENQRQYQKEQAGESPHACKLEDGGTRTRLVAATMQRVGALRFVRTRMMHVTHASAPNLGLGS